ncbi:hypothetical protein MTBLM5_130014 [Magnetospirillum sp. LM-5]|uniref:DUF1842 domain-containing protein n=1 Tax=Magnetospirillum sp. LM-5 TaxID=2681466 RepID=UPI00137D0676|nr:DUF1842 domain-containing protein [Magnetospirillum sp. LM-5]CAA7614251.1 hypothetical protein MTBLM5_130014 [Magnetospirillum sp. LM-5]
MTVGTFLVSYVSSETMPGGCVLSMQLVVDTVHKTASGIATVTQATNPPLDVRMPVSGPVITMTVMPNNTHFRMDLQSQSGMVGRNLSVMAVVGEDWQTGVANVHLFTDTAQGTISFTTPIKTAPAIGQVAAE